MEKINICLGLIYLVVSSISLNFGDTYYEYEAEGLKKKGW